MNRLFIITLTVILTQPLFSQNSKNDSLYLFSYFIKNGKDGLHLAYSHDGYNWEALNKNKSILKPEVGEDKLMRDPCLIQTPDGTFHMVWTVSWGERGIGYASSKDLVTWSEQRYFPVMEHELGARNCWAPEIIYDVDEDLFMVYWATTIPDRFPKTDHTGDNKYNHRMYYVTSRDMGKVSEAKLLYDRGFNVIDASIVKCQGEYVMFLKDETRKPKAEKNIRIARSASLTGPYSAPSDPIYDKEWVEGPTATRINNKWIVYFDKYAKGGMGAVISSDLTHWKDVSEQLDFPKGTRHGTVLKVSKCDLKALQGAP